jgi:hypothetical protein
MVQSAAYNPYGNQPMGPPAANSGVGTGDIDTGGYGLGNLGMDLVVPGLGLASSYFGGKAQEGYNTAAQGAAQASQGYGQLANWNWNAAMGGLDQANAAYNPSNSVWQQTYGNQAPNAMQNWYAQHQSQYDQPQQSTNAYNQYNSYMQQSPSSTSGAYNSAQQALGGQARTANFADQFGKQLTGQYSQQELAYKPGNYDTAGAGERFNDTLQQNLGQAGRAEGLQYQNTSNMSDFAGGLAQAQGEGATHALGNEIMGHYRGANDVENYANQQMGGLGQKGLYEQFVQSDIMGNNPASQRETDQGLARINQEMARRGGFKSGGADTAIGNFLGEMGAKDYQNRAMRAQSAQGMELSRIGAGQSLATASAQGKLAQGSAQQGLAGQLDAEKMSRLAMQMQAQQGASTEGFANSRGRMDYAQAADQGNLSRQQMMLSGANMAQNQELNRLQAGMSAAGQSDRGQLDRMNAAYGYQSGAERDTLARQNTLFGMAHSNDQNDLARYGMLGQLAGQNDQTRLAYLTGGGNMANQTTQANQTDARDRFSSRYNLDQAQAGNIGNFYGMGMQGYDTAQGNSLNALANYYQLMGQGQSANAAMPFQIMNTGMNGARMVYGAKGGG